MTPENMASRSPAAGNEPTAAQVRESYQKSYASEKAKDYAGASAAYSKTASGAMSNFKNVLTLLMEQLGIEDPEEILDEMYPEKATGVKGTPGYEPAYDPSRTKVPLPPPIGKALPNPGGQPQLPGGSPAPATTALPAPPGTPEAPGAQPAQESAFVQNLARLVEAVRRRAA